MAKNGNEVREFKVGDIVKYDKIVKTLYIYNGELGYCSSYGDFVSLKDSAIKNWKKVKTL